MEMRTHSAKGGGTRIIIIIFPTTPFSAKSVTINESYPPRKIDFLQKKW